MKPSIPVLLEVARAETGISQTGLAKALRKSQAYISKVESGVSEPTAELLASIAEVLDLPDSYFSVQEPVYPQPISFHRTRNISKTVMNRIWATTNMLRFAIAKLLQAVDVEPTAQLPALELEEYSSPQEVARTVRAGWRLAPGPVGNLVQLIEATGALVVQFDFGTDMMDGVSHMANGSLPPLVFLNSRNPGDRARMTLAHEVAHLVMHRFPGPTMELEANAFASEFLMPKEDIGAQLQRRLTIGVVGSLKRVWGTSMASMIYRAHDLGAITESQYRRLWIQMAPYRKVEPYPLEAEEASTFAELWRIHREELHYTGQELLEALPVPRRVFTDAALGVARDPVLSGLAVVG